MWPARTTQREKLRQAVGQTQTLTQRQMLLPRPAVQSEVVGVGLGPPKGPFPPRQTSETAE